MDYDCTFGVKHYEEGDAYLTVIPRYYFGNDIASWFNTEVGEYYNSILTESNKKSREFTFITLKMVMINIKYQTFLNLC